MSHLDRRLDPDKTLSPAPEAGVKDGPNGQTPAIPTKACAIDRAEKPAPDVLHDGVEGCVARER